MKTKAVLLICLFFLITSCAQENILTSISDTSVSISLKATLPPMIEESDTKAYASSFTGPYWEEDDEISVINLTTGKVLGGVLKSNDNAMVVQFNGTVKGTVNVGDNLAFLYPSIGNANEISYTPQVYDISEQDGSSQVKMIAYATAVANSTNKSFVDLDLDFKYLMSFFKVNMANLPASTTITQLSVTGLSDVMTLKINTNKTDFAPECSKEKGKILITGNTFNVNSTGAASFRMATFPSEANSYRKVRATIDDTEYQAVFASSQLYSNRYYNTISSNFELTLNVQATEYGIYDNSWNLLAQTNENKDQLGFAYLGDSCDFSVINAIDKTYWKIYNVPTDIEDGMSFTLSASGHGIEGFSSIIDVPACVIREESDGDNTKLWIKTDDFMFVLKK